MMQVMRFLGQSFRKWIWVAAFVLVPFGTTGTSAEAGELPKTGTYTTNWSFSGPYMALVLADENYTWMSEFTLVVWNEAGEGFLHDMSGHCNGFGVNDAGKGYCSLVDADDDKIFWAFTDVGGGKGSAVLEGGTGKYAGLQGSEEYTFVYTPDNPEGTFHGYGTSKGSYTLP